MGSRNEIGSLTDKDVDHITRLIEKLDCSSFEFLQLDAGNLRLTVGKGATLITQGASGGPVTAVEGSPVVASPSAAPRAIAPVAIAPPPAPPAPAAAPLVKKSPPEDGTVQITAPLIGLFYSKPDPSSPPFVSVGTTVTKRSTVCLIEVMKVFNSIPAGVDGVITEVCVRDAEMVESGQALFRVRPTGTAT